MQLEICSLQCVDDVARLVKMEKYKDLQMNSRQSLNSEMNQSFHYSYKLQGKVFFASLRTTVETWEGKTALLTPQILIA